MIASTLLAVCAIINIALIIALVWRITTATNEMLLVTKQPEVSYWDISNFIFLNKVPEGSPLSPLVNQMGVMSEEYKRVAAGLRGLLWFILIQGILQVILSFAWPKCASVYAGGRR